MGGDDASTTAAQLEDLIQLGAPDDVLEEVRAACRPPAALDVYPENWAALEAFLLCDTQWRVSDGAAVGLDYAGVAATLDFSGVVLAPGNFQKIKILERAALAAARELREKTRRV